ncbi:hypothetical protein E4T56_gene7518, partial [Termitomyces sp. T112]
MTPECRGGFFLARIRMLGKRGANPPFGLVLACRVTRKDKEIMALRPYIVGNWKMNGLRATLAEARAIDLAAARYPAVAVGISPPFSLFLPLSPPVCRFLWPCSSSLLPFLSVLARFFPLLLSPLPFLLVFLSPPSCPLFPSLFVFSFSL